MTNVEDLQTDSNVPMEHSAPLVSPMSHPLTAEAEVLSGVPACEESHVEASAQATFEKTVYRELGTPFKYRSVAVLIVHWAAYLDYDLRCGPEVEELRILFEDQFRFKVRTLTLDDKKKAQNKLNSGISRFIDDFDGNCRTNLLIVYYTGHGEDHSNEDGLHIKGKRHSGSSTIGPARDPTARWKAAEDLLLQADADILTILDTCNAGSVIKSSSEDSRMFEVLAAVGKKDSTSGPGPRSFTRAMIETLKEQLENCREAPFTSLDLHQAIMRRRKNQKSQLFSIAGNSRRFIKLTPLTGDPASPAPTLPSAAFGLTLRFVFANSSKVTGKQAEQLATALSRSVAHSDFADTGLEAKAIEWVDFGPIVGANSSGEELKLHQAVRNAQQLWRASAIWKACLKKSVHKRELDRTGNEEADDAVSKRARGGE